MKARPILIDCIGGLDQGHLIKTAGQTTVMCQMCGQRFPHTGGPQQVPVHDRRNIPKMVNRGTP